MATTSTPLLALGPSLPRRRLLALGGSALVAQASALHVAEAGPDAPAPQVVRIASVATDVDGGLLPALLAGFEVETGLRTRLQHGNDPYGAATRGEADLVISHYGHHDTERFVTTGLGLWPRTVFSNQSVLIGPPADPARVRGLGSLVEAFRRIAASGSPYVVNHSAGVRYLTQVLWHASDRPPLGPWYLDEGETRGNALARAASQGAYLLWGLTPFLREQQARATPHALAPLLTADPLLQRVMVAVPVNPARLPGVNAAGAQRLLAHLLSPAVQARILTTPYRGAEQALWAPVGRHNAGPALPG